MIRYIRSARSMHGRGGEAIMWANEVARYINTQYTEFKLSVFTPRFGPMNNIYWYADVEDLAVLDRWQKQIGADPGYRDLRRKAVDLFVQDCVQIVGMAGVASIGGKMLLGTLSDKIGREVTYTLVIACGVCGMIFLIVFTFLASPSIPFLYALLFGLGYAGTALLPPLVTAIFFAGRTYGKIFGVIFVFTGIGGAFGPWLAGFFYDHMGTYVSFLFLAIACAISACLAVWIAAPRKIRGVPGKRMD